VRFLRSLPRRIAVFLLHRSALFDEIEELHGQLAVARSENAVLLADRARIKQERDDALLRALDREFR
jgi:hypothetical protein